MSAVVCVGDSVALRVLVSSSISTFSCQFVRSLLQLKPMAALSVQLHSCENLCLLQALYWLRNDAHHKLRIFFGTESNSRHVHYNLPNLTLSIPQKFNTLLPGSVVVVVVVAAAAAATAAAAACCCCWWCISSSNSNCSSSRSSGSSSSRSSSSSTSLLLLLLLLFDNNQSQWRLIIICGFQRISAMS